MEYKIKIFKKTDKVYLCDLGQLIGIKDDNNIYLYKLISKDNINQSTTFEEAINQGNLKAVKHYQVNKISALNNDFFNKEIFNKNLDKHIFVLKEIPAQSNVVVPIFTFNVNQTMFEYQDEWVDINEFGIRIKTNKTFETNKVSTTHIYPIYVSSIINLNEIENLVEISSNAIH